MEHEINSATAPQDAEYSVIDLGKYVRILWRGRFVIAACAIGGALLAALAAFLIRPAYDADVRLMPPAAKQSAIGSLFPQRNPGDLYLGLISSRTVLDDVIEHQKLTDYFHTTNPTQLRRDLSGMTKFSVDKDQFVTVVVRAREPETALRIANEFPRALYRLNQSMAVTEAEHRWEYFAGPLEQEKDKLAQAEEDLKQAEQKTGVILPEAQVQLGLGSISGLKQEIRTREEQLAGLMTSSTDQSPPVIQLRSQIAELNAQLQKLEAQTGGGKASSSAPLTELTLEVERKEREVKFHEALFDVISHQYENARVDDSYSPPVQLVDAAVLPNEKSWPPRKLFFLAGFFVGGFLGLVWVWARSAHVLQRIKNLLTEEDTQPRRTASGI